MDTLTSLKVFRSVVESGSFVGAADRLDLSTAMVSKHVMSVEKRIGVRLLNRNNRGLSLTERYVPLKTRCFMDFVLESAGSGLPRSVPGLQYMGPQNVRCSQLGTRSAA